MSALRVLVVSGGISHERDVSLRSGRRVSDALTEAGCLVTVAEPNPDLFELLATARPDVVVPMVHGASGEDGALLGLLELAGSRYVGSASAGARLAWSKPLARDRVAQAGLSVPVGIVLSRDTFRELSAESILGLLTAQLAFPIVVKPGSGGSAQGVSVVREPAALARALVEAFTYSDIALCEAFVAGIEVAVSVWNHGSGPVALPVVEIAPNQGVYSFEARYNAGETTFFVPARVDQDAQDRVAEAALLAHHTLGLGDFSRVDFIVDTDGRPWFLEANSIPGFTETSLLPLALEGGGLSMSGALGELVRRVANR